jgi:putative ABC transport system permease protein
VEENFVRNLSFPLIRGNAGNVLASAKGVVLSATTARKFFGDKDPMGRTIEIVSDIDRLMTVVGIAADAPANSSIQFGMVMPLSADPEFARDIREQFNHMDYALLVELSTPANRPAFLQKMNKWMKGYFLDHVAKDWQMKPAAVRDFGWFLRPFADGHYNVSHPWGHYTDVKSLYQLGCIVLVILLLASMNYVLIAVSNAASRSQEIGVRKVMGAGRGSVILQFWVETQVIVGFAVLAGLGLALLGVPLLNKVIGSGVTYGSISWGEVFVAGLVLSIGLGVLAGYYPAMLISKLKPVSILQRFSAFRVRPGFSRVLVVVQFSCCVVLMMAAFVIDRQMEYVNHKDLGFEKDQVLMIGNPTYDRDFTKRVKDGLYAFARTQPSIVHYSAMNGGLTGEYNTNGFKLNGQQQWMRELTVDFDYFELLGLQPVQGRFFNRSFTLDTSRAVRPMVVNEAMVKLLGKDFRLGVFDEALGGTIIGVVKDYHIESLSQAIQPTVHVLANRYAGTFLFKVRAGKMPATIAALEAVWKKVSNNYPFEYTFLDETITQMYAADMQWRKSVQVSCGFAILIACMGLFGLAAITAANRTREVGIRKILGASVSGLAAMMSRGFLGMVGLSFLIAVPLSWWLMNRWLGDFAYRIELSWWMFGMVGLIAVAVAMITIGFQVLKVARANPVRALRQE